MVARVRDDERARLDEIAFELLYEGCKRQRAGADW